MQDPTIVTDPTDNGAVTLGAVCALLLKWVLLFSQVNQPWIALLLPVHLALFARLRHR